MEQIIQSESLLQQKLQTTPLLLGNYPQYSSANGSSNLSDDIIPSAHTGRTLVLCFDGTGEQFSADNSNIVQLFSMLVKDDPALQMVYYQAGIGTYTIPEMATPMMAKVSKTIDMMIGNHLNAHVMGGYEFLMQNYEAGDKICIFGFSRGAYTARALAGMIYKVGLLPRCNHQQVPFAYHMYSCDDPEGWKQSNAFKKAFSINVNIEFVGVWDTVSSVGIIPKRLPFTASNNNIRYFRHALSLDEHRVRFKPSHYIRSTETHNKLGVHPDHMPRSIQRYLPKRQEFASSGSPDSDTTKKSHGHHPSQHDMEQQFAIYDSVPIVQTNVEEVWFAGCHSDVGGGSVANGTRNSLARIPLRWMIREIFKLDVGILFHRHMFTKIGMDPETLKPSVVKQPRPPPIYQSPKASSPDIPRKVHVPPPEVVLDDPTLIVYSDGGKFVNEELEDLADATCPMYDQLHLAPAWWILEVLPQKLQYQDDKNNALVKQYTVNMGDGRHVPRQHQHPVKIHRSVKIRMEADNLKGGKYWPNAKLKVEPEWID
ncbi:hypothetical protein BDR07DRAFT_1342129 [Suillus spraguei]|nr:hypothetical protein BDR07DRAFT_1342129 [Suillus spraguei]